MALTFGEKIRESRKTQNLTQKQLANLIGAAHNSISDWENNKNKPDPDTIELLCGVLKITPNYLLASSEDDFSPKEKIIIKKYRNLDPYGQQTVDIIIEREATRSAKAKEALDQIKALKEQTATIPLARDPAPDYLTSSAAHARTDISDDERTPELARLEEDMIDSMFLSARKE